MLLAWPALAAGAVRSERPPEPVSAEQTYLAYKADRQDQHPRHDVRVWTATYRQCVFQVVQLPRCEHLEAVITHEPSGETLQRAKIRMGGVAACTGSYHNSRSMSLADFLQEWGSIVSPANTGRWFLEVSRTGQLGISGDYALTKGDKAKSAIALGQRLIPLHQDGFSLSFMNRVTDRMALGVSSSYIYIVQGKSDIWRLADFMQTELPCTVAINSDGGHVVRGRAPVHIVFRWRKAPVQTAATTRPRAIQIVEPVPGSIRAPIIATPFSR